MSFIYHTKLISNTRKTLLGVFLVLLFVACGSDDKSEKIPAIVDRTKIAKLKATDITTLISDSGITRYRISTPSWNIYDQTSKPYWEFPKGIHLERFDQTLKVDANIQSKYAKFYQNEKIWELRGNVKVTNLNGERFETEQLFWNQQTQKFYTDSLTRITQASKILTVIGFESDQTMSKYSYKNLQGIIQVKEEK